MANVVRVRSAFSNSKSKLYNAKTLVRIKYEIQVG